MALTRMEFFLDSFDSSFLGQLWTRERLMYLMTHIGKTFEVVFNHFQRFLHGKIQLF
jgi:hypothetical protein